MSESIPVYDGPFDAAVDGARLQIYFAFAGCALVTYDIIICLAYECRLVWRGRWGIPAIVYLVNRYGVFIQSFLDIIALLDPNLTTSSCLTWNLFTQWSIPAVLMMVEAMLVLRVTALYARQILVRVSIWTGFLGSSVAMYTLTGLMLDTLYPMASPAPSVIGCQLEGTATNYWSLWVPSLVLETVLVILTLWKAVLYRRECAFQLPLMTALVRDGSLYFVAVFVLMVLNLIIASATSPVYFGLLEQMTLCIASVLCSRLFLNLRHVAYTEKHGSELYELTSMSGSALPAPTSIGYIGESSTATGLSAFFSAEF